MNDINIIVCNNKIYFDGETIAEIRELSEDSDYYPYKMDLERIEAKVNDGKFHNLTEVSKQIESICTSYEGDRDSVIDCDYNENELTQYSIEVLDEIRTFPEDSIFRKRLQEAESNNDIPTMNELVHIYDLVKAGVFTLEMAEKGMKKSTVVKCADEVTDM